MANVFYRRGIIETWGRGILKIMDLLDKAGLPEPEFFNQAGSFDLNLNSALPPANLKYSLPQGGQRKGKFAGSIWIGKSGLWPRLTVLPPGPFLCLQIEGFGFNRQARLSQFSAAIERRSPV
jgi:hypothetical protein